jgi:phenylalanyl-tRNA synthetase alpha chain
MVELREHERKTLLTLEKLGGKASVEHVLRESGLSDSAVMRAALTLQEKKLVKMKEKKQTVLRLTSEGKLYTERQLPERRILDVLYNKGGEVLISKIPQETDIPSDAIPVALGWLVQKNWAMINQEKGTVILTKQSLSQKPQKNVDEKLLEFLAEKDAVVAEELDKSLQQPVFTLKRRKLIETKEKPMYELELTEEGWKLIRKRLKVAAEVTQLTPELIISGKWQKAKLQKYNIEAPVARTWPGKKHPYLQFLDEVKEKLVNLGFKEMTGTYVETSFFNFDALYTPQGHPAREPSGVYYVKSPKYGSVDAYRNVVANVKKTHENGWKTGSSGWQCKYSVKEAGRLILRSHTTCLSARTLLSKDLEVPGMYFSIGRCYRPEVLDKTHLTEFNQVEGIVVDKGLTLRHLLGVLEKFAIDIAGADKAKFVPDYFPFTEPSVELRAYKKGYGWIEFGGSGIFRPEVTLPLGIKVPVLAWGLGIDRLFMLKAGIDDIRQVFPLDLDWLRRQEVV